MSKYKDDLNNRDIETGRFTKTHDLSETREYGIWGNMLYRCNTKTSHLYDLYGGRGVSVELDWCDFDNFINDMGFSPTTEHSIDRIDPNGNYCKENCRWALPVEQARNRRNSVMMTYKGETLQVDDMCEKYNLSKNMIKKRIRRGWSDREAIETPPKRNWSKQ